MQRDDEARRLYEAGHTAIEIAGILEESKSTTLRRLHRSGVKIRSRWTGTQPAAGEIQIPTYIDKETSEKIDKAREFSQSRSDWVREAINARFSDNDLLEERPTNKDGDKFVFHFTQISNYLQMVSSFTWPQSGRHRMAALLRDYALRLERNVDDS